MIRGTRKAASWNWAPQTSTRKPAPSWARPRPNLISGLGSLPLRPSQTHRAENTGANMRMKAALNDCTWGGVMVQKPFWGRTVLRSANWFKDDPACS